MVMPAARPLLILCALHLVTPGPGPAAEVGPDPAASALARGDYPWYDAKADALKPVKPPSLVPKAPQSPGPGNNLVQTVIFALVALVLTALVGAVAWAYHQRLLADDLPLSPRRGPARAVARSGPLPAGLDAGSADPLAEAARLRAAGDYAAAVVRLFAHQLLTLDRLRLARLAPGRTGRQVVRSVANRSVRALVEPTLRLFEEVYYGHAAPAVDAFEAAWTRAQELERLIAEGGLT